MTAERFAPPEPARGYTPPSNGLDRGTALAGAAGQVAFRAESHGRLRAPAERVFAYLDDHSRLSAHMSRRTWRMGWGRMDLHLDERAGRALGSRIRLEGRVFGVRLAVAEVVTEYAPPTRKVWMTLGTPRLLFIGPYRMGFALVPAAAAEGECSDELLLTVFIDYALPVRGFPRLLGVLFAHSYARWCTSRMVADACTGSRSRAWRSRVRAGIEAFRSVRMPGRAAMAVKASLFHAEIGFWLLALGLAIAAEPSWAVASAALALGLDVADRIWARRSPAPMPYFMRWVLHVPRGPHAPARVKRLLQPRSGERILEIGPGVGVHAIPIAAGLQPDGILDVLDVQQQMLDELARNAARRGLANIVPRRGDAQRLPYPDAHFDAAYLVSVLGEIPDPRLALGELRSVLKPEGRLLVCEVFLDPDFIPLPTLCALATEAGFQLERRAGFRFVYTAVFRRLEEK